MAEKRRRTQYQQSGRRVQRSQGNLAYNIDYESPLVQPDRQRQQKERMDREEVLRRRRKAREQAGRKSRSRYQTRQQDAVAPLGIVGFAAIILLACSVLGFHVKLNEVNQQVVQVRQQLSDLQAREKALAAEYEQTFDMQDIENRMVSSGTMIQPDNSQIVYLELDEPDNAVVFNEDDSQSESLWSMLVGMAE